MEQDQPMEQDEPMEQDQPMEQDEPMEQELRISITYETWRHVPEEQKEALWLNVKDFFDLKNNDAKKTTIKQCNLAWKRFKTRLKSDFMDQGRYPPDYDYTMINKTIWETFCKQEEAADKKLPLCEGNAHTREVICQPSEESSTFRPISYLYVKEMRILGRLFANLQKNHPHLGRLGYHGRKKVNWDKIEMNEALKNEIKNMDDLRTQEWITARLSKPDSQGNMIFSPDMDDLIKRLVESDKRKSQGLCEAGIDPLIEEFGPEHGGRTRGLGNVGFRKGIEGYVQKKKRKREVDESLLTHKAEVIQLLKKAEVEIKATYDKKIAELESKLESRQSSCGSTTVANHESPKSFSNRLDEITESAKCYLFSPYTKDKTPIAWGVVYPIRDGIIHGVPIIPTYMKVTVDKVLPAYKLLKLPVPAVQKADVQNAPVQKATVQKVVVQKAAVQKADVQKADVQKVDVQKAAVQKADVQNATLQKPVVQKAAAQVALKQTPKQIQALTAPQKAAQKAATQEAKEVLENRLIDVGDTIGVRGPLLNAAYLRWMSRDDSTSGYVVDVPAGMFVGQEESFSITVDASDILEMWTNGKLDASIGAIQVDAVKFQPLWSIKPIFDSRKSMPSQYFRAFSSTYDFFLAPFIEKENHWVLFVVCPKQRACYILDSHQPKIKKRTERNYWLTSCLNKFVANYKVVECNQQAGLWECGLLYRMDAMNFLTFSDHFQSYWLTSCLNKFVANYKVVKIPWHDNRISHTLIGIEPVVKRRIVGNVMRLELARTLGDTDDGSIVTCGADGQARHARLKNRRVFPALNSDLEKVAAESRDCHRVNPLGAGDGLLEPFRVGDGLLNLFGVGDGLLNPFGFVSLE
ncbi:ulp1 protease family, C-terminal catalytic domain-containing protein [Tanacetum coccineum]